MKKENATAIIILAAGASRRMPNTIKQLLPWNGSTFLGNTIKIAQESKGDTLLVVLGAYADKIREECNKLKVNFIVNPNWEDGLGSSIAFGVSHIQNLEKKFESILIFWPRLTLPSIILTKIITPR